MQREFIYNGGLSTRYHTADVLHRQTIAEHSFGVAWFCEMITEGNASKNLIMAALEHDLAEHLVGDIPSPAKRALGLSRQFQAYEDKHLKDAGLGYGLRLNPAEEVVLKLGDMMDGMMFCLRERSLGNRKVESIFNNFKNYTDEFLEKNPALQCLTEAYRLRDDIVNEWEVLLYGEERSQHNAGRRNALSGDVSALGLVNRCEPAAAAVCCDEVHDTLEEKERTAGS